MRWAPSRGDGFQWSERQRGGRDDDVMPARRPGEKALQFSRLRDIQWLDGDVRTDFLRGLAQACCTAAGQGDSGSLLMELLGDGKTDTGGAAGHQDLGGVLKRKHGGLPPAATGRCAGNRKSASGTARVTLGETRRAGGGLGEGGGGTDSSVYVRMKPWSKPKERSPLSAMTSTDTWPGIRLGKPCSSCSNTDKGAVSGLFSKMMRLYMDVLPFDQVAPPGAALEISHHGVTVGQLDAGVGAVAISALVDQRAWQAQ